MKLAKFSIFVSIWISWIQELALSKTVRGNSDKHLLYATGHDFCLSNSFVWLFEVGNTTMHHWQNIIFPIFTKKFEKKLLQGGRFAPFLFNLRNFKFGRSRLQCLSDEGSEFWRPWFWESPSASLISSYIKGMSTSVRFRSIYSWLWCPPG